MKLREAVTLLEDAYRRTNLSYYLSYEGLAQEECEERKVSNSAEHLKKGWWFQRDLNPCLSLERTDEKEGKQQLNTEEPSKE